MGDRAYGEYATVAGLKQRAVDVIARLHQKRTVDFRKARRLGKNDGLFTWKRGYQQSEIFTKQEWSLLPETIQVRILRFIIDVPGFRSHQITLVTTLLDPKLFPAHEQAKAYARRWRLEMCLRDQDDSGHGILALPEPGDGTQGNAGVPHCPQPDPMCHGGGGPAL